MLLKKRVKAGVLLYALLMAFIFLLFLQFYIGRVLSSRRQLKAQEESSQAYLMALLTNREAKDKTGQFHFDKGSVSYERDASTLQVMVHLINGKTYTYEFYKSNKVAEKEPKKADRTPNPPDESISETTETSTTSTDMTSSPTTETTSTLSTTTLPS